MSYGPGYSELSEAQKRAVDLFINELRSRFPAAAGAPEAEEKFGSLSITLVGVPAGEMGAVEAGMQDVQTQILLDTGNVIMLMPG